MAVTHRVLLALPTFATLTAVATARVSAAQRPAAAPAQDSAVHDTATHRGPSVRGPRVVLVSMIDAGPYGMAFSPVRVSARLGDTLRFVMRGRVPHNVEFRGAPPGADLQALGAVRAGPLLARAGDSYDVVLDRRFRPGRWVYVCTPHEVLGMAGTVTVLPDAPRTPTRSPNATRRDGPP